MNARTLIACAAAAAALPMSQAWANANATTLGGPQGTGFYGVVDPLDLDRDGMVSAVETAGAGATVPADLARYDTNGDGVITQNEYVAINQASTTRGNAYAGDSWATNPPVPAP